MPPKACGRRSRVLCLGSWSPLRPGGRTPAAKRISPPESRCYRRAATLKQKDLFWQPSHGPNNSENKTSVLRKHSTI